MADDIDKLRREIDAVDDELLKLINRRAALAGRIGSLKQGAPAYRPERETQILRRVADASSGPLPPERVTAVFREVISACRGLEEAIRVSYLGPEGTFSEQAVRQHFGAAVEALPVASVDEAFRRCEAGTVQFTVVPVENSTEGVVGRTLDLLLTMEKMLPSDTMRVAKKCIFLPTRSQPKTSTPRKPDSRKKAKMPSAARALPNTSPT